MSQKQIEQKYLRRKHKTNTVVKQNQPDFRLVANKSNLYTYAQVLDQTGSIVAQAFDKGLKRANKIDGAKQVGIAIAKVLKEKGVKAVAFDRNGYKYHGRIQAIAEGVREGGVSI
ncbi:MAG TPA: 50S ribosomal protein L18 [Candidatus Absconditabacterales bacterium]|nr:50S ribosomal protein L18 [Candidatus Absconditabacterales bacterium]